MEVLDGGYLEIGCDGMQDEGVGAIGVVLLGNADRSWADNVGEAAESVGKFVGILESASEELVLGVTGSRGDEFEVERGDGRGDFESVEMDVE